MIKLRSIPLLAPLSLACAFLVDATPAKAVLNYNIYESLGSLIIETSGSLNLPSKLTNDANCSAPNGAYDPSSLVVCTGPSSSVPAYQLSTGPTSLPGILFNSFTTTSGISTVIRGAGVIKQFGIVSSYISGQPIVSSSSAPGKTLADLGLTPSSGTLGTWTLATTGDTINVRVFNPVPGPLPVLGASAAFAFSRRLRQRIQRSKAAANL